MLFRILGLRRALKIVGIVVVGVMLYATTKN